METRSHPKTQPIHICRRTDRLDEMCFSRKKPVKASVSDFRFAVAVPVTGLDLHFLPLGENRSVAAVETGGKQHPTGVLHLYGFESGGNKKYPEPLWVRDIFVSPRA